MFLSCKCSGTLVFLCCHPGRLASHGFKVGGAKPIPCAHICQVGHVCCFCHAGVLVPWCFCAVTLVGYQGTVLKWEGPSPYLVLTYVKWVMGDVSVMQVYWYLGVFVLSPW